MALAALYATFILTVTVTIYRYFPYTFLCFLIVLFILVSLYFFPPECSPNTCSFLIVFFIYVCSLHTFFVYCFGGLECVCHSFANVAHFVFLRNVWIRTQRAAVASRCATNLATHLLSLYTYSFLTFIFIVVPSLLYSSLLYSSFLMFSSYLLLPYCNLFSCSLLIVSFILGLSLLLSSHTYWSRHKVRLYSQVWHRVPYTKFLWIDGWLKIYSHPNFRRILCFYWFGRNKNILPHFS